MSTDSPAKTLFIISFIAFLFLSITSMIADSSFAFSSDQQTSIFFFPFSSIHIFATVSPQWVFLSPLRVTWMCLLFSFASAGNTDKIKQRKYISLPISSFLFYLYYQVSTIRVSACKNTDLFRNCQKFYENSCFLEKVECRFLCRDTLLLMLIWGLWMCILLSECQKHGEKYMEYRKIL